MKSSNYTTQHPIAQNAIIWDCPACDSDEAQYHRTGIQAGIAVCKVCGHTWHWRKKTTTQPKNIDTENASSKHPPKKGTFTERTTQSQTALKDIGPWLTQSRPPSPTHSVDSNYSVSSFRSLNSESALRSRQKVQELRQWVAAKNSTSSSSKKAEPKHAADEMLDAWPKPALKKTVTKKPLMKERSQAQADSGSSESEFEYNESDDDFEEEQDTAKRRRAKGKQLAVPKKTVSDKDTPQDNDDDDDDDNDSIFSDTGNDVYMSGDELDEEEEKAITQLKDINEKSISRHPSKAGPRRPNAKNKYSMWIMYNKANRHRLAAEHPYSTPAELSKLVSAAYRQMPLEEREELRKISNDYRKELAKMQPPKITAPRNGYVLFTMEVSAEIVKEHPEYRMRDRNAVIARRWRELSEEKRKEYSAKAKQMRDDFQKKYPEHFQSLKEKRGAKTSASLLKYHAGKKRKMELELGLDP